MIPTPRRLVWWPSLTVELQLDSLVTAAIHPGGSLQDDVRGGAADHRFMAGTTFTVGGF